MTNRQDYTKQTACADAETRHPVDKGVSEPPLKNPPAFPPPEVKPSSLISGGQEGKPTPPSPRWCETVLILAAQMGGKKQKRDLEEEAQPTAPEMRAVDRERTPKRFR